MPHNLEKQKPLRLFVAQTKRKNSNFLRISELFFSYWNNALYKQAFDLAIHKRFISQPTIFGLISSDILEFLELLP